MFFITQLRKARRKYIKATGKFILRRLNGFMGRQSLVGDEPIFDPSKFQWVVPLEANWQMIRSELDNILKDKEHLPAFHELSPDQSRISKGDNWKTFVFWVFKHKAERNCQRCPETTRVLESIPNLQNAWFSILAPGYHIPPHRGVTKGVIRCHLALKVPKLREKCTMRVSDKTLHWEEGKCVVLDDTFEHEVWNNTDEERVVLFLDIDRPMRVPGFLLNRILIRLIKWSAYVKDARKNLSDWENRYENLAKRVNAL